MDQRRSRSPAVVALIALIASVGCGGGLVATPSVMPTAVATGAPSILAPSPSPDPGERLQAMLDDRRASYGSPGVLAVLRFGRTEWTAWSGSADLAGTPITAETRFRIASITKSIVGALVVDAVGRGEVALDDVVGDLLPGLLRDDPPVTVRQLLDHTSGIFDPSIEGEEQDIQRLPADLRSEAEAIYARYLAGESVVAPAELLVALAETRDRYFSPGSDYHYSNTNYQLVGLVLERVTGQTLAALLAERIVGPLGLRHTTLAPFDTGAPEMRGYDLAAPGEPLTDVTDDLLFFGNGGSGGILTTAAELLTIMQAIAAGRFASPELLVEQTTPNLENYGLGIATYALACGAVALGHEGLVDGTRSIALVSPDGRDGVVIAFNLRSGSDPLLTYLAGRALCWR